MRWLSQTFAVLALNLRTIPQRLSSSAVAIVGIAGVVVVFVSVLSIAAGFSAAMQQSGSPQRALVMRTGADSEMTSGLGGPEVDIIKQAPGIRRDGQNAARVCRAVRDHRPAEEVGAGHAGQRADARHRTGGDAGPRRGLDHRRAGCSSSAPTRSSSAAAPAGSSRAWSVGNTIVSGQNRWQVVGIFEADGGVAETEDLVRRASAAGRLPARQFVSSRCSRDSTRRTRSRRSPTGSTSNPTVNVMVRRENEYYAGQSRALTSLIQVVGFGIAALMGIGAIFGAILTMYTAVATRAREIATLRALGFNTQLGAGVGARRVARARPDRRHHRRPGRVLRVQRLPDVDDELPDVQPGRVRVSRHAATADDRHHLRA